MSYTLFWGTIHVTPPAFIAFCFTCARPRISQVLSPQKAFNPSGLKQTYVLKMDIATFCHKGGNDGFCFGLTSLQNPD